MTTGWDRFPVATYPAEVWPETVVGHLCPFTGGELRAMAAVFEVRMGDSHKIAAKLHAHADLHTRENPAQP